MTEKPLAEVIAELRKLHEAATPAPWDVAGQNIRGPDGETIAYWEDRDDDAPGANQELTWRARNALPRLLDTAFDLSRFQSALERVRQAIIDAEARQGILHAYKTAGCDSANIPSEVEDFLRAEQERDRVAQQLAQALARQLGHHSHGPGATLDDDEAALAEARKLGLLK